MLTQKKDALPRCWGMPGLAEVMPTIDELKKLIKTHEATSPFFLALKIHVPSTIVLAVKDNDGFLQLYQ